ncbi:hypothetical protein [Micromonospora sp. NPDC047738]
MSFTRWAPDHRRNAEAWANDRTGADLTAQIDPDFRMGPQAVSVPASATT